MTLQSFYRSVMTMEYQIHLPEYILKCINKDKPQFNCNGQCELMKKIKAKEQKESKKNFLVYEYSSHYMPMDYLQLNIQPQYDNVFQILYIPHVEDYCFDFNTSVFRPPVV